MTAITKPICPHCGKSHVWRKGYQPTIHGRKLRYQCYDCGHSFYPPKPAPKPVKIRKAPKARKAKGG